MIGDRIPLGPSHVAVDLDQLVSGHVEAELEAQRPNLCVFDEAVYPAHIRAVFILRVGMKTRPHEIPVPAV